MTAIEIYKSLSQPPATALRQITGSCGVFLYFEPSQRPAYMSAATPSILRLVLNASVTAIL